MAQIPSSLRGEEVLALALGLGISTLTICARMYTKIRLIGTVLKEDCGFCPVTQCLIYSSIQLKEDRFFRPFLGMMSAACHGTFIYNGEVLTDAGLAVLAGLHCGGNRYRQN